ncbi:hypothetical protein [Corynebacterium marquesiae]|uniref:hypothetical protein n=1 Tax=Corynebacterium marquesiae TaxID=2913503 RepID=UPI0038D05428
MDDPTRIDPTLESLRRAWEGQPNLSLPTFFAMLANQGIGWGATDDELVAELERQARVHPPLLPLEDGRIAAGEWLVLADAPHLPHHRHPQPHHRAPPRHPACGVGL